MDDRSLRCILEILRKLQSQSHNMISAQFIELMAGSPVDPATTLRIASYILELISQARSVIDNSNLVDEAKAGVIAALSALEAQFNIRAMGSAINQIQPNLPGYISNFVILLSAAGLPTSETIPDEAKELADEIDEFSGSFDDVQLDPVVRDIAKKHMAVLSTLIRHIPVFGLEAALTSYFELVAKLRRADSKSTDESKRKLDGMMEQVKKWGERLKSLDDMITTGANLLDRAHVAAPLLQYIPGLG